MRFRFLPVLTGLFFLTEAFSQTSTRKEHDQDNYNALMFSFDFASNTNVLGNFNAETRQPSISPSVIFFSKWGFDLSAIGNFIDNSDDSLQHFSSELDLMLGYTYKPHKNITIYPTYAHYFYSENSNALKSLFSDDIRADIDYNYKFFDLGISAGYYIGKMNAFYASAHNYYRINFMKFLSRNGLLSIQPGIDANFGSYEYLNLYYVNELRQDPSVYTYLLSYPAIRRYVYYEKTRYPGLTYKEILDAYLEDTAQDNFKLTSVSLSLPVYYMNGNFGINLGLFAFIPINQPDYLSEDVQFYFDIGLTYNLEFR